MGPHDRKQRELEKRKKLILEKSRKLFFKHGYEQVTIQDICDAVEYGKSTIYSMFESKEEIYSHIYLDALQILGELNKSINPDGKDFDAEFMKAIENIFSFYRDYRNYYIAIAYFNTNSMAHSKIPPAIMDEKKRLADEAGSPFALLLDQGIKKNYIKKTDIEEFITLFFSSITGIIGLFIWTEQEEDEETIHRFCKIHGNLYLNGLKKNDN